MIGRIVRSVDFERVMASPGYAKTRHFVLHHLAAVPSRPGSKSTSALTSANPPDAGASKLSTARSSQQGSVVDDSALKSVEPGNIWLGLVVPKRHAKRSVTRQLLKRQMRAVVAEQEMQSRPLNHGLWVLRLRATFEVSQFPSAASAALAAAVRQELQQLLQRATQTASTN